MGNLNDLEGVVQERLHELGLQVTATSQNAGDVDLRASAPTSGGDVLLNVLVKAFLDERAARKLLMDAGTLSGSAIVAAPKISPAVGAILRDHSIYYLDSGGNAWIDLPGFKVQIAGQAPQFRPVAGVDRPSRAFKTAGSRVIFVWLVQPSLVAAPMREIARAAGVAVGAVHNTTNDLADEGELGFAGKKRVLLDEGRLARRWVEHFVSDLRPSLKSRQLSGPPPDWWLSRRAAWDAEAAVSGEAALALKGFGMRPTTTIFYSAPPWPELVRTARKEQGEFAVVLRERFWDPSINDEEGVVPPLLVYADALASGDSRQIDIAEEMARNEPHLRPFELTRSGGS
ncbi:hypothetical protein IEE94_14445 [Yimella sp. cx-573]|nr:hypothetical protein [Yimella sp. cx-573]